MPVAGGKIKAKFVGEGKRELARDRNEIYTGWQRVPDEEKELGFQDTYFYEYILNIDSDKPLSALSIKTGNKAVTVDYIEVLVDSK